MHCKKRWMNTRADPHKQTQQQARILLAKQVQCLPESRIGCIRKLRVPEPSLEEFYVSVNSVFGQPPCSAWVESQLVTKFIADSEPEI